jgi:amino acid permease
MSYLGISEINLSFDPLFISDVDSVYNPKQAQFYNETSDSLKKLTKPVNEQLKKIHVNTYYYKRYKSENNILYVVIAILILIIILSMIRKKYPIFDDTSYSIIVGIILAILLIYIVYSIWKLFYKDELNYDEYNYGTMSSDDITSGSNDYNSSECNRSTSNNRDISYNVTNLKNLVRF